MTCILFLPSYNTGLPPQIHYQIIWKSLYNFANARHGLSGEYSENGRSWEGGAVLCVGSSYIQVHAMNLHKLQNNLT